MGNSSGYIASKGVFLLNVAGSQWWSCNLLEGISGDANEEMTREWNFLLRKENIREEYELERWEIMTLLSDYLKKVGKAEAQGLSLSPIPFDIMLPQLVKVISDSNDNIGTGDKKLQHR